MAKSEITPAKQDEKEMSLLGHLGELRMRLIICVVFLVVASIALFFVSRNVLEVLILPVVAAPMVQEKAEINPHLVVLLADRDGNLRLKSPGTVMKAKPPIELALEMPAPADAATTTSVTLAGSSRQPRLIYSSPLDQFTMPFKISIILGILVSLPVWVWQIWLFVAPGLTDKERRVVGPMLISAIGLFPIGAGFAYAMLFFMVSALARFGVSSIEQIFSIDKYVKIMTNMMIVFGFIFELPLVVALLARVGILTPAFMRHYRRHIYVALAVVAMVITPSADIGTMFVALIPLIGLFEVSILVAGIMSAMRQREQEQDELDQGGAA